jgi:hypothetical protein
VFVGFMVLMSPSPVAAAFKDYTTCVRSAAQASKCRCASFVPLIRTHTAAVLPQDMDGA